MGVQRIGHDWTTKQQQPRFPLCSWRPGLLALLNSPQFLGALFKDLFKQAYCILPLEPGALHPLILQSLLPTAPGGSVCSLVQPPHALAWCSCFWLELLHILNYWDVTRKLFFSNLINLFVYAGSLLLHSGFLWLLRVGSTRYLQRLLLLRSTGFRHAGFSSCGAWA